MKMPVAIIRADGGHSLGMGHLARAGALAVGLIKNGVQPLLVTRNADSSAIDYLNKLNLKYRELTPADGLGWKNEGRFLSGLATQTDASLIFLDIDNTETRKAVSGFGEYTETLKRTGKTLVIIDGPYGPGCFCDLLIIPYFGAEPSGLPSSLGKILAGPEYFIFREEFQRVVGRRRIIRENADRVLVSMGGSDPGNFTLKAINALRSTDLVKHVKIVYGGAFSADQIKAVEKIIQSDPDRFETLKTPSDMAELMLWSDVALVSGGLTKYELAATGTPGISLAQHDEEDRLTKLFASQKSIAHLGRGDFASEDQISAAIKTLLGSAKERELMSLAGKKLVDGRGLERVLQETIIAKPV